MSNNEREINETSWKWFKQKCDKCNIYLDVHFFMGTDIDGYNYCRSCVTAIASNGYTRTEEYYNDWPTSACLTFFFHYEHEFKKNLS